MGTQSEQLEQQAHQLRARISATMQTLRHRMTPGQVVDQVADYAQHGPAAEFFRNLGREARENPLPLALTAIGAAWLIVASSLSRRARSRASGVGQSSGDMASDHYITDDRASRFGQSNRIVPVIAVPDDQEKRRAARFESKRVIEQAHEQ
jgi:hypothetical protein